MHVCVQSQRQSVGDMWISSKQRKEIDFAQWSVTFWMTKRSADRVTLWREIPTLSLTMILPCMRMVEVSQRTENGDEKSVDIDHGAVTVRINRNNAMSININRRPVNWILSLSCVDNPPLPPQYPFAIVLFPPREHLVSSATP